MKSLYTYILLLFVFVQLNAQTPYVISQNTSKCCGGDDNGMGSSFLTIAAGKLDSIEVYIRTGSYSTGTLYVYAGNTTAPGSQIYTQSLTGIPTGILNAPYRAKLTSPVSLSAASTYTFMIHNTPLRYGTSNTYADGSLWVGAGFLTAGEHADKDLDFIAYIGTPVATGLSTATTKDSKINYTISDRLITLNDLDADEIVITNLLGQKIMMGVGKEISVADYAEGIYILSIRVDSDLYSTRIYLKP